MGALIRMNMWRLRMSTSRDILTLTQWLSPAYPVGAFAYSHGLEAAIRDGLVTDANDLKNWLSDVLEHGSGRNDCILIRAAYGCEDDAALDHVNQTALAFAASAERQLEMSLQGAAFCNTTRAVWGGEDRDLVYPVAVGAAAARLEIDVELTTAIYLQSVIGNLTSAAQRLMALGQTQAQSIIAGLSPLCDSLARGASADLDDLASTAFLSDIAAMRHETLQPRIFRS